MELRRIEPDQFKTTAWSGGITREIFIWPPWAEYGRHDFICRVSTAIVESRESVFTDLPEFDRFIMPLNGELVLSVDQVRHHLQPFEVFAFDGGAKTTSLSRSNLQDLNLIVKKGHAGVVEVLRSGQEVLMDPEANELLIKVRLDETGSFHDFSEVLYKSAGEDVPFPALGEKELAIRMKLPI